MKKLAILLLGIMMVTTAACGKKTEVPETVVETEAETLTVVSDEMLEEEGTLVDDGGPAPYYREDVSIAGKELRVGWTTYNELIELGFTVENDIKDTQLVYENAKKEVPMKTPDGKKISIIFQGRQSRPSTLGGSRMCGFDLPAGVPFDTGVGVTSDTTEAETKEIEGFKEEKVGCYRVVLKNSFVVDNGLIEVRFNEDGELQGVHYEVDNINF